MLTRLIQRKQPVAAAAIEYEYRDAEYEYEYEENRITEAMTNERMNASRTRPGWLASVGKVNSEPRFPKRYTSKPLDAPENNV